MSLSDLALAFQQAVSAAFDRIGLKTSTTEQTVLSMQLYNDDIPPLSPLVHMYLRFRIWLGRKLFRQVLYDIPVKRRGAPPEYHIKSTIVNIGFSQFLKVRSTPNEVRIMRHLAAHSSIPLPRVQGAWMSPTGQNACYLLMSKVPGSTLQDAWDHLNLTQRKQIAHQLKLHIRELRLCRQSATIAGQVCSFDGGNIEDWGLHPLWTTAEQERFANVEEFVNYLLLPFRCRGEEQLPDDKPILLGKVPYVPVLTHGDMTMRNIMVDPKTFTITGILDWTTAAWMPPYWERYKATYSERALNPEKRGFASKAYGRYLREMPVLKRVQSALTIKPRPKV